MKIGVVSDTHSQLRPEVLPALRGVDHIFHAGDVGDISILARLGEMAPVTAIRGNVDTYGPCADLPEAEFVNLGGLSFYLIHNVHDMALEPVAAGIVCVVSGHTHKAASEWRSRAGKSKVLYFNPGSCGPRRFSLPVTVGFLEILDGKLQSNFLHLR